MPINRHNVQMMNEFRLSPFGCASLAVILLLLVVFAPMAEAAIPRPPQDSPQVRRQLISALRDLDEAIADESDRLAVAHIERIAGLNTPGTVPLLLDFFNSPQPAVHEAVRDVFRSIRNPEIQSYLVQLFEALQDEKNDPWTRRVFLVDAFAYQAAQSNSTLVAQQVLRLGIQDPDPNVRLATVLAIREANFDLNSRIDLLVAALQGMSNQPTDGRARFETRRALTRLTGYDFSDARGWTTWWSRQNRRFTVNRRGTTPELSVRPRGAVRFFDAAVASTRVAFVVDTGETMRLYDFSNWPNLPNAPFLREDSPLSTGIDHPDWIEYILANPQTRRVTRLQTELEKTINSLPASAKYTALSVNQRVNYLAGRLTQADRNGQRRGMDFVDRITPQGNGDVGYAVAEAFQRFPDVDTIYVLTNREPAEGQSLIQGMQQRNRFRNTVIHTLSFNGEAQQYLQALAAATGGQYTSIIGPPRR